MAFGHQPEFERIYNLLMTCVVNDRNKTKHVCELLGQGFNLLIQGPFEEYFIEQGVPYEWYCSESGQSLKPSDFDSHRAEFEQADDGLKWQWFLQTTNVTLECCFGKFLAKIDVRAGMTDDN